MSTAVAYIHGVFYTMEEEGETCSAVVVRDGKFLYCGTDEKAKAMADEVVDLKGAPVLPGMIDTHQHVFAYARNLTKLNLEGTTSLAELKARVKAHADQVPDGQWILGFGFDHEKFDVPKLPTRYDLDEACPNNPLIITRNCLHVNVANSLALKAGGIDRNFQPKVAGTVEYDENGEPDGVLYDAAAGDITATIPDALASLEAKKDAVERACREMNEHGLTGVTAIQGKHCDLPEYTEVYQELAKEGRLTMRVYLGFDELPGCSIQTGLGDDMVKYGFYKLYGDGNLGGRTAYFQAPYADAPDQCGVPNYTQEELNAKVQAAYDRNIQVAMHTIVGKALDMLLTAFETVYHANPKPDPRFRIIHMSVVNDALLERARKLPVIVDVQPMFVSSDMPWVETRLGAERARYSTAFRKMIDAGLRLSAGSDSPCESYDPMGAIYAAVNRRNVISCGPEGGWYPENCVTVYEAVSMYTSNAAYASFEENLKGTIKEGKLADFVVLDKDVFQVDPLTIKDIKVLRTYLGGELVYARD